MPKVTYLFGAGASADCLPLVSQIPERLNAFREFIVHHRAASPILFADLGCNHTEIEGEDLFITTCERLVNEARSHASIDTYAKKLFITGRMQEYRELKAVLTCFFIYEQTINPIDKRYDTFFASILGTHANDFKGDVRILSWNYDYQFEKAYSQYSGSNDLHQNQQLLNVFPGGLRLSDYRNRFSIFKINGTTGFNGTAPIRKSSHLFATFDIKGTALVEKFVWYFLAVVFCGEHLQPMLKFAWELTDVGLENNIVSTAATAVAHSDALVIIGYSFPFFNRDIDKILMAAATDTRGTRIYVQDRTPENIIDRLDSVVPRHVGHHKITPIRTYDQFYLPAEL